MDENLTNEFSQFDLNSSYHDPNEIFQANGLEDGLLVNIPEDLDEDETKGEEDHVDPLLQTFNPLSDVISAIESQQEEQDESGRISSFFSNVTTSPSSSGPLSGYGGGDSSLHGLNGGGGEEGQDDDPCEMLLGGRSSVLHLLHTQLASSFTKFLFWCIFTFVTFILNVIIWRELGGKDLGYEENGVSLIIKIELFHFFSF